MESKYHAADDLNFLENFECLEFYGIINVLNTNQTVQNHPPFSKIIEQRTFGSSLIHLLSFHDLLNYTSTDTTQKN